MALKVEPIEDMRKKIILIVNIMRFSYMYTCMRVGMSRISMFQTLRSQLLLMPPRPNFQNRASRMFEAHKGDHDLKGVPFTMVQIARLCRQTCTTQLFVGK